MTLFLNIGNSRTQLASLDEFGARQDLPAIDTAGLDLDTLPPADDYVAISVVPKLREKLQSRVHFLDIDDFRRFLDFSLADVSTLGMDRAANSVALAQNHPLPGMVVDCGTAITFEIVDAQRRFVGGAIAPGRQLMRDALHHGTAQLPEIPMRDQLPVFSVGANTADALLLGVDSGAHGMVRGLIEKLASTFGGVRNMSVVFTGGDGKLFFNSCNIDHAVYRPGFTLDGVIVAGDKR